MLAGPPLKASWQWLLLHGPSAAALQGALHPLPPVPQQMLLVRPLLLLLQLCWLALMLVSSTIYLGDSDGRQLLLLLQLPWWHYWLLQQKHWRIASACCRSSHQFRARTCQLELELDTWDARCLGSSSSSRYCLTWASRQATVRYPPLCHQR